jgi:large subunit ribosomal protein L30
MAKSKQSQIKVKLVKSTIGQRPRNRATVRALGLRKINSTAIHESNPSIMGMINTVSHLVAVEEVK